jgi:hypothetical protein
MHRKRIVLAIVIGLIVFGAVFGLAASLNVSSNSLGAGSASVAACQSGTLTTSYATSYSSSLPGYQVGVVTVNGLQSGCYTKSYRILLANSSNTSLGELTGTTPGTGTSFTADFTSSNVSAAAVANVYVTIAG